MILYIIEYTSRVPSEIHRRQVALTYNSVLSRLLPCLGASFTPLSMTARRDAVNDEYFDEIKQVFARQKAVAPLILLAVGLPLRAQLQRRDPPLESDKQP